MLFSSYEFLLCFLPLVIIGYFLLSKIRLTVVQRVFLVVASLIFYAYNNPKYLILILTSILVNYLIAYGMQGLRTKKYRHIKSLLCLGVLFNVALIGYYKYYDFFVENINALTGTQFALKQILLPLGISFFTFQQLSFLISVYKGEERVGSFLDYTLFISFFPQLIAGPIVLYGEIIPQLKEDARRYFNAENFAIGLYVFSIGLFKKTVISDALDSLVNSGYSADVLHATGAWVTTICYTLQIYFDFSGYSDMAVGLGKMFNIDIPENFRSPYKSASITEFWKRWHITLGRALGSYIYIPLGGNRKGEVRTCVNLLLTFFISGLWHGASWTFVLWGVLHGVLRIIERCFSNLLEKIPRAVRVAGTFLCVNFLWVLFRAESFAQAASMYRSMFDFTAVDSSFITTKYILALLLLPIVFFFPDSGVLKEKYKPTWIFLALTVFSFVVALVCLSRGSAFIYFNF